ncbi:interleukin-3 receptor subunit alpha isoform X1 [Cervus canadensis]|uniref:interleukin-3 receptor subunit alpha isoform X1 n=2 Tax=Cervus canadensis TaxID=1574408 RepID=UPI001CA30DA6|nr:interleukin-3 receptor subunit alpha isoform X1 [Cervus canadensis]XP_043313556.1 interleukin-3 receptor subunit alpha isoform X1 [Cervus canadensis]XP_043313557.1 interleukin-3 receptor subunit alpha isoform X1 [Cervus canadensis]
MALLWLAVLLTLICRSMTTDHAISDPDPITNLRIDPQRKRLVWEQHGNVSKIACYVNSKPLTEAKGNQCTLGDLSCEVKNYTVKVMKGQPFSAWIQYPKQGNPRAAADNLTCRVHDVDQLSCSWAVGKEAPADVQYYFYLETWPCPKYMQNQQGVNVQCHFDSISLKPQLQSQTLFRFLVNGTSGGSKIPCRETLHRLQEIEILAAPNITKTWCNKNYSFMEWEVKSLFTEDLKYELEIQKGTDLPYKKETELKTFMLRNPGPYTVKVKAMDSVFFRRRPQGQWSAPQHLDCDRKDASFPLWLVYLLAPLGALLLVGLLFLCRRWPVMRKLFPRVPHVKDPIGDSFQNERMVAWDPEPESQEDCPVAQVQVLGET